MGIRRHLRESMKVTPTPVFWPKMIVCAFATIFPLLVGLANHQLSISIYGALIGFLLVLNDHFGTLGHRLWIISLTFGILLAGMMVGMTLKGHPLMVVFVLMGITYWAGLMGGKGAEFERAILFSIFQLLAGAYSTTRSEHAGLALAYAFLGYTTVVVGISLLVLLRGHAPNAFTRVRTTLKYSLTLERERHLYAIAYATAVFCALAFVEYFKIDHGYWAVGAVVIIMKPETTQSIYRSIQRFLGTLLGVGIAEIVIFNIHTPLPIILVLLLCGFLGPWALAQSYWLGSMCMSVLVLLILDIPSISHGDLVTPMLRLQATAIGCVITIFGVILARILRKKFAGRKP